MSGPEHYREAERLLTQAALWEKETVVDDDAGPYLAIDSARLAAQAHATLALVAATAQGAFDPQGQSLFLSTDWSEAVS